jgi:hypothetical protein
MNSEFKEHSFTKHAVEILGPIGKMLSMSKGAYSFYHSYKEESFEEFSEQLYFKKIKTQPKNIAIFNANVLTKAGEKIWYGDIDITLELSGLTSLAKKLHTSIYVLYESDARFGKENNPNMENFVLKATPEGYEFSESLAKYITMEGSSPVYKKIEAPKNDYLQEELQSDFDIVKVDGDLEYYLEMNNFFDKVSRDRSPLDIFYRKMVSDFDIKKEDLSKIYLHKDQYDELKQLFTIWANVYNKYMPYRQIEKSVEIDYAFNAPRYIRAKWAEGLIMIKKD